MMQIGMKMQITPFLKYQRLFNFGSRTGIDLPNESTGVLYDRDSMHEVEPVSYTHLDVYKRQLTEAEIGKVITVAVTSSIETGSLVSAPTDAVIKEELKNDHLIINQVYGGGANDSTPVSHSFIELYNPTDNAISLEGYSLSLIPISRQ